MSASGWIQVALFLAVLTALTPLLGGYLTRVLQNEPIVLDRVLGPVERGIYRLAGTRPEAEQDWKAYAKHVLLFNAIGLVVLFVVLRLGSQPWDLAINTSTSFVTNTNWQYYGGESTLSNVVQMFGLATQNFLSAAVGIAVLAAVIRGFARRGTDRLGNFTVDLTRTLLYVLLPISVLATLFFVSQGVVQSLDTTRDVGEQVLRLGPVASQEAIKLLGTNGGGFFNVNSAYPFENPTGLSNVVSMLLILLIPAALTNTFGRMVGSRRQGWALYAAMSAMFAFAVVVVILAESHPTAAMHAAGLDGANMEGKETRFGIGSSSLFAVVTTVASCGAVNAAMEAFSGLGGAIPMANMMTGEVIFGGVGSGLYGMLLFVLLAVFLAGLMVGRTPEFLGKKIGAPEIRLVAIGTLAVPLIVLVLTAIATATDYGQASIFNAGPNGFSETLYAYTSQANNNGSAFAGYTAYLGDDKTVTFANLVGGLAMLLGRFAPMVTALAVGGLLARKTASAPGPGTMRTDTPTFVVLLIGAVVLVALLTFVPALLLGPIAQGLTEELF